VLHTLSLREDGRKTRVTPHNQLASGWEEDWTPSHRTSDVVPRGAWRRTSHDGETRCHFYLLGFSDGLS
jgi:hypothetical protein